MKSLIESIPSSTQSPVSLRPFFVIDYASCSCILLFGFFAVGSTSNAQEKQFSSSKAEKESRRIDGDRPLLDTINSRSAEIDRLIKEMDRNKNATDDIWHLRINMVTKSLVQLQAIEAVPVLCQQIAVHGSDGKHTRPAAEALSKLGGSALPGMYGSLEETQKTDLEIRLFAFIFRSIDRWEELTVFRLESEIKHRTEATERNTTFKENARELLKCFATPNFFRFENNPFYDR